MLGTDTTITAEGYIVLTVNISANAYSGFSLYVNGVVVDAFATVSGSSSVYTCNHRVHVGDVVKAEVNSNTTGTCKLYGLN